MKLIKTEDGQKYNTFQMNTRFEKLTDAQLDKIVKITGVIQLLAYNYCFCLKVGKAFTLEEIETELKKIL